MKPKFIALNLLLLAALVVIGWQARSGWNEAQAKRQNNLNVTVKAVPVPPLTSAPRPDGAQATKYADVATKNLFSKDRNPNVVIEPPKVEKPKPMPPLPVVYGVLGLPSGTKAIMAERAGMPSKPVHAGDAIGEFTIASLDPKTVVFDWDGKQISKKIEDLIDRSNDAPPGGGGGAAPGQGNAPAPPPRAAPSQPVAAAPGQEYPTAAGQRQKSCVPGDSSPAGTVVDGFRKNVVQTPFGPICSWTQVQ